jgi:hypothetical protein
MPFYFMLHDAERFHKLIRPVLAASWRQRSFAPCTALRSALTAETRRFLGENRIQDEESMLLRVSPELPFAREMWRYLVGEVLLVGAAELPEIHVPEETLRRILHPGSDESAIRPRFAPIQQALYGTRDLVFGDGWYRPDHAGYNDRDDTSRLCDYLCEMDAVNWTVAELAMATERESAEELEFARQALTRLRALYQGAREDRQITVCEQL